MTPTDPRSRRVRLLSVLALSALAALAATASPAFGANCGKRVVNDWFDNGRVDSIYPLACYREAIRGLPPDVVDYGSAKEEISRALAYAKQGKQDPGVKVPTQTTSTMTPPSTGPAEPTETTPTNTTPTEPAQTVPDPGETSVDTSSVTEAGGDVDTAGASSVPVPLIVLGGLAILLLAAGSAGYLARRSNGRKGGDGPPPASA